MECFFEIDKKTRVSPSSSWIDFLPDYLLLEIFRRLPCAKSAIRCKSVSKRWYSLISTYQSAISMDQKQRFTLIVRSPSSEELLLISEGKIVKSRGFDLTYFHRCRCDDEGRLLPLRVIQSHMGLLLCCPGKKNHSVYYICNPITRHWVCLPPTPKQFGYSVVVGFLCEPCSSGNRLQYRYKVIRLAQPAGTTVTVETFSSDSNNWRRSKVEFTQDVRGDRIFDRAVVCNGTMYWWGSDSKSLIAYNPVTGQFRSLDRPTITTLYRADCLRSACIGLCHGALRILFLLMFPFTFQFDDAHVLYVWELDCNTGGWSLKHEVCFTDMVSKDAWIRNHVKGKMPNVGALALDPNNSNIVYLSFGITVVSCNLREKELTPIAKVPCRRGFILVPSHNGFALSLPWWPVPVPTLLPKSLLF